MMTTEHEKCITIESRNDIADLFGEIHRCQLEFLRGIFYENLLVSMLESSVSYGVKHNSCSAALKPGMLDGDR